MREFYSAYDRYTPPARHIDPVVGGRARAARATRDLLGRFNPNNGNLTPDPEHGKIGGVTRARSARRDGSGRFI